MNDWKDSTSYSRGSERVQTAWKLDLGGRMSIVISKGHIYYPESWIALCDLWYREIEIGRIDKMTPEQAQRAALDRVKMVLSNWSEAIREYELRPAPQPAQEVRE